MTTGGMQAKAAMQDARSDATFLNPRDRQVTLISLSFDGGTLCTEPPQREP